MKTPENPSSGEPVVDAYEASIFAAELGGETPELDLHGMNVDDAIREIDRYINHEALAGTEVVKIIHGRGTGKLRAEIHKYLRGQTELVARFRDSNAPGEMGGATYAVLHRLRK